METADGVQVLEDRDLGKKEVVVLRRILLVVRHHVRLELRGIHAQDLAHKRENLVVTGPPLGHLFVNNCII